jgi:hypothetical protein
MLSKVFILILIGSVRSEEREKRSRFLRLASRMLEELVTAEGIKNKQALPGIVLQKRKLKKTRPTQSLSVKKWS